MTADAFIDTNILLYAVSTDENEAGKRVQARQILVAPDWGLSVQVLQEFYAEDLNHGQDYDGVRVINPFLSH